MRVRVNEPSGGAFCGGDKFERIASKIVGHGVGNRRLLGEEKDFASRGGCSVEEFWVDVGANLRFECPRRRLGLTKHTTPEEIEQDLMAQIDRSEWDITGHLLVFLGRRICAAKKPDCEHCPLADGPCPSAFAATNVGRKKPQARS
jgi:hypothetical protein